MCGFAGVLASAPPVKAELQAMGRAIRHRGPDSSGVWIDEDAGIGLAHQRLAIVDLSDTGAQPMTSRSERYVISYNGEIYNGRELQKLLTGIGHQFRWRGTSDTEILLETIDAFGLVKAISCWVGMFSFVLWDRQERKLWLARDRFGEKPLLYGWHQGRFIFGSELGAITSSAGFRIEIDQQALGLYFRHHYVPAPYSILSGIQKLGAGQLASVSLENPEPKITQYWSPIERTRAAGAAPFNGSIQEVTEAVSDHLERAISGQSVADVPVGAFLSGGIDSTAVVGLMQKTTNQQVKTFSVGFGDPKFNEAHYAKAVAQHLETAHTELYLTETEARDLVFQLPSVYDEPFADSSQLPTLAVSQLARSNVTVSLSGDGGDELFGGYTRYQRAAQIAERRDQLGEAGQKASRAIVNSVLFGKGPTGHLTNPLFNLPVVGKLSQSASRALQLLSHPTHAHMYRDMISFWRTPSNPAFAHSEPDYALLAPENWLADRPPQEAVQMLDVLNFLPDQILVKVDRAAMHVSLESRVPLLDHRLAEFVWSLPADYRANRHSPKQILFDIACKQVPKSLIDRPKMGFGVPLDTWLRGPLRDWAETMLEPKSIRDDGLINEAVVTTAWQAFKQRKGVMADHIWSLLVFQSWHQRIRQHEG